MIAEEAEILPHQPEAESEISVLNDGEEKNDEELDKQFSMNEILCFLSVKKEDKSNFTGGQTPDIRENLGDPTLEDVLGDNIAINFEPPGRYLVETQVNFMTTNMSLSMRRTVRMRPASQQRSQVDPETALALITKPCLNYKIKAREILKFIKSNPEVADLKITFYMLACDNRTALKPYPTSVVEESEFGQESLSLVNEEIPSIKLLKIVLRDISQIKTSMAIIAVLHWLLILLQEPKLKRLPSETFYSIFQKVDRAVNFMQPTHVFKLMFSRSSPAETTWQAKKRNRKSYFGFYTDSLDKMHSIIHVGFYPALFQYKGNIGPGVFFYTDLKHCLENAGNSSGWGWGKSDLGVEMRVVLVAEFLEGPEMKFFNEYEEGISTDSKVLTNGQADAELLCFFAPRPDEIRIRYILVFVETAARNMPSIVPVRQKTLFSWIGKHKTSLFIGGTVFLTLATKHYLHVLTLIHALKAMMLRSVFYNVE